MRCACTIALHGLPRKSMMDKALYAADPLSGLIVACALIRPEKKLAPIDTDFVMVRFKEKRFAAGANRDQILACQEMGLDLVRVRHYRPECHEGDCRRNRSLEQVCLIHLKTDARLHGGLFVMSNRGILHW